MPDLVFTTRGTAQVIAEQERLANQIGKQKIAAQQLSAEYRANENELKRLGRVAEQIHRANETGQERYNRKMVEARAALKGNVNETELLKREQQRLQTELDKSAASMNAAFAPGPIMTFLTSVISVSSGIALIRQEVDALRAEKEKITQAQLTAAGARDQLKRNIAPAGRETGRKIEARADALAAELNLPQSVVDIALAEAFSSSENEDQAFNRARVAGAFLKTRPEGMGAFTGALGDISKATKDPNDLRNLGFLINVSARSRVADDQKFSDTFPVAAAGMASFGATAEESGALFDALGIATADSEGRITGTGGIQLAKQLAEKVAGGSFGERLNSLWNDPAAAKAFVDDASFESKVTGPMQEFLLNKNSPIARQYREMRGGFGTVAAQVAKARETMAYLDEGRTASAAAVERTISSGIEKFQLQSEADLSNESREKVIQRMSQLTGNLSSGARLSALVRTGLTMSPQEAIGELESGLDIARKGGSDVFGKEAPSEAIIKNTEGMIAELKKLLGEVGAGTKEQQETNRLLRQRQSNGIRAGNF